VYLVVGFREEGSVFCEQQKRVREIELGRVQTLGHHRTEEVDVVVARAVVRGQDYVQVVGPVVLQVVAHPGQGHEPQVRVPGRRRQRIVYHGRDVAEDRARVRACGRPHE
jgi:hypothetical protein